MQLIPTLTSAPSALAPLAQAEGGGAGGGSGFMILMLLMFGVLIFFSMRASRKQQKKQIETRQNLVPGREVMTSAGIFGTVRSVDLDNNKLVLEVSPGNMLTMHLGAVTTIVEPEGLAGVDAETTENTPGMTLNGETVARDLDDQPSNNPEDPRKDSNDSRDN